MDAAKSKRRKERKLGPGRGQVKRRKERSKEEETWKEKEEEETWKEKEEEEETWKEKFSRIVGSFHTLQCTQQISSDDSDGLIAVFIYVCLRPITVI